MKNILTGVGSLCHIVPSHDANRRRRKEEREGKRMRLRCFESHVQLICVVMWELHDRILDMPFPLMRKPTVRADPNPQGLLDQSVTATHPARWCFQLRLNAAMQPTHIRTSQSDYKN